MENMSVIKSVNEIVGNMLPSNYVFFEETEKNELKLKLLDESIPVIDFSLLESESLDDRRQIIEKVNYACRHWGFFIVVNHGVPEKMIKQIVEKCKDFFVNLSTEEKKIYEGTTVFYPIRYGTSYNQIVEDVHFWRDFLKVIVHPKFHCPAKPKGFREIAHEYSQHVRRISNGLLKAICISLGINEKELETSLNLKEGQQVLIANYYPPCPQPELAIGLPPHSDHGLLTLLVHNQVSGLQISRDQKWLSVDSPANAFLVNVGDQLEILTNGEYKSILHRVMVNNSVTRVSVAVANGPSLDAVVQAAPELITEGQAKYKPMTYRNYLQVQQTNRLVGKSGLDIVRGDESS